MPIIVRQLNKHGNTFLIGGFFLFFSILLYLALCTMPCELEQREMERYGKHSLHTGHETSGYRLPVPGQEKLKTFLVVLVLTSPDNKDRRDTIRETWLCDTTRDVMVLFAIGTQGLSMSLKEALASENRTTGDLLLLPDLKDSYNSLTSKVLQSFVWLDEHVGFKFLFKCDDDTFARMSIIIDELKHQRKSRFQWGFFDGRASVKKSGPWAEHNWILCDHYLPHARGGGYILSADLVCFIAENSKRLMKFNSEDISVGAWLAPLDITRQHDPRFDTEYKSRGCSNRYIVTHKQSMEQMRQKHRNLRETGQLCMEEVKLRNSYIYNWQVKPSDCCSRDDPSVP